MPYCEIQCSEKIEDPKAVNKEIARVIELIPGKSERWVMTHLEDQASMSFAGDSDSPCAMLAVRTFGELSAEQYDMLTREFCGKLADMLKVAPDRMYVVYTPEHHWGWNSENF